MRKNQLFQQSIMADLPMLMPMLELARFGSLFE
jgi:hypothetical protein